MAFRWGIPKASEYPDSPPDQFRHNRPFFLVFVLRTFTYITFRDTAARDIEPNLPPPPPRRARRE